MLKHSLQSIWTVSFSSTLASLSRSSFHFFVFPLPDFSLLLLFFIHFLSLFCFISYSFCLSFIYHLLHFFSSLLFPSHLFYLFPISFISFSSSFISFTFPFISRSSLLLLLSFVPSFHFSRLYFLLYLSSSTMFFIFL